MSGRTAPPVRGPRLNPFAFPSDTTLRFVLLVIFVVCGSARLYGEFRGQTDPAAKQCTIQVWSELSKLDNSSPADIARDAASIGSKVLTSLADCAASLRPEVVWKSTGICLVILVAAFFYYSYPAWKLRTGRLEPISASELPEVAHELQSIAETARLPNPPIFVWNPLATGLPVVFGRHGRYHVALSGSFVAQYFYTDKDSFRAIMLHELGHIHNGDVAKTYLTMSLWLAFLATALAPSFLLSSWHLATFRWLDASSLILNSVVWTGVIMLSGLAVLRAREYYADVRASAWDQTSQIDRVLAALSGSAGKGWRRYLRFHPDPTERRQIVEDPSRLLRLSFGDAFGIGIAAWFAIVVVSGLLLPFWPRDTWAAWIFFGSIKLGVPAVVFAFAIGAIGIGVWRSAFASSLKGDLPSTGTGWLGIAFVAGALPGVALALAEGALQSFAEHPLPFSVALTALKLEVWTYIALLVGCLLIFGWISQTASAWFEVVLQSRSPRPILLFSVATALFLVVGALALASFIVLLSFTATPWRQAGAVGLYMYGSSVGGPIIIASMVAWAFPLVGIWRRKQITPARLAPWVFLDGASPPEIPSQKPVRPAEALLTGVVIGLLYCLWWELVIFRSHLPAGIGNGIGSIFGWLLAVATRVFGDEGFSLPGSAAVLQALAAAVAAARATRLSAVCGLFAASVAGFIMVVGHFILFGIGSEASASRQFEIALPMMGLGAIVALPMAILAAWIGNVARRATAHPVTRQSDSPTMRRSVRGSLLAKGSVVALCVVVGIGMTARVRNVLVAQQEVNSYRESAERGDSDAQHKLASMYADGRSVGRDDVKAVFWWRKAAEQGHAAAQSKLANMYFRGLGVAQDDIMAAQWVRRAAEQGHADAENGLGFLYAMGRGVANDDSLALQWFRKAAEQGHADAQNTLGTFHARGRGTAQDDAVAVEWFRKAATQGHVEAQNNLGTFHALGRGTPRDDVVAVEWFRKAAERGHADAQNNLGYMYQQGRALPKDQVLALQWFLKAAERGHTHAQFVVGEIYEVGEVVAKDDDQAVAWFRKAADKDHPEARNRLSVMCGRGLRTACSSP